MVISEFKSLDLQRPQNLDFLADNVNFSSPLKSISNHLKKKVRGERRSRLWRNEEGVWQFLPRWSTSHICFLRFTPFYHFLLPMLMLSMTTPHFFFLLC